MSMLPQVISNIVQVFDFKYFLLDIDKFSEEIRIKIDSTFRSNLTKYSIENTPVWSD